MGSGTTVSPPPTRLIVVLLKIRTVFVFTPDIGMIAGDVLSDLASPLVFTFPDRDANKDSFRPFCLN